MAKYIPSVGSIGYTKFKFPFDQYNAVKLRCVAVYDAVTLGEQIDLLENVYLNVDLTQEHYEDDLVSDLGYVQYDDGGDTLYVPVGYIMGFPIVDVVPYKRKVICIDLGELPENLPIDNVLLEVGQVASRIVGITQADVFVMEDEVDEVVLQSEHEEREAIRLASVAMQESPYVTIDTLRKVNEQQAAELTAYKAFIESL